MRSFFSHTKALLWIMAAFWWIIAPCTVFAASLDLEKDLLSSFVLETKKISIPGFPDAFNPSIVRFQGSLLMSFRTGNYIEASESNLDPFLLSFRIRDPISGSTTQIGLVFLDTKMNLISNPQILTIPRNNPYLAFRQQDPRLINVGDRLFIVYSNIIEGFMCPEVRRMFVSELLFDGDGFTASPPECLTYYEGENEHRWQKNWVPFDYKGQLLLAYSLSPHRIMKPRLDGSCIADTIACTSNTAKWDFGILRGGTPALLEGNEYLSFFHSSKPLKTKQSDEVLMTHYFMGAYTFQNHPPFAITRMSKKPIVGKNFYNGIPHKTWKPLRVVFPCGYVSDKKNIWVVYGRQDHELWMAKIDKNNLFKSLVPVTSLD